MRSAPFAAYRWSRATGSTRTGHPAAGAAHYGVVCASHVLYRVPMIPLFRHTPLSRRSRPNLLPQHRYVGPVSVSVMCKHDVTLDVSHGRDIIHVQL